MNYYVVYSGKLSALIEEVNKKIENGWKPLGGISISESVSPGYEDSRGWHSSDESTSFAQAMIEE